MNKDEFEQQYCERSKITFEEYNESQITLPCTCEHEECEGWAAVSNHPLTIKAHNKFYTSQ